MPRAWAILTTSLTGTMVPSAFDIEIAVDIPDVDRQMNGGLAAVDQNRNAAGMGDPDHVLDRNDGAKRIRHRYRSRYPGRRSPDERRPGCRRPKPECRGHGRS